MRTWWFVDDDGSEMQQVAQLDVILVVTCLHELRLASNLDD